MCSWLTKFRNVNCQMWSPLCYDLRSSSLTLTLTLPAVLWSSSYSLIQGSIRSTVGQGRLVMSERFHQVWHFVILFPPGETFCYLVVERFYNFFLKFTGLVDNCEFGTGERETTAMDLTGFWEMIYIQVWVNCWDLLNRILTPDFPGGRCGRQVCEAWQSWSRRVGGQRGQGGEESSQEENLARLESRSSSFLSTATNFPI